MNAFNCREELVMKRKMSLRSQIDVANEIGVSQSQYSKYELGYADPTNEQAEKLVELFDLPNDYFVKEEE